MQGRRNVPGRQCLALRLETSAIRLVILYLPLDEIPMDSRLYSVPLFSISQTHCRMTQAVATLACHGPYAGCQLLVARPYPAVVPDGDEALPRP